jgi:two-component system LytT family sensor kinase
MDWILRPRLYYFLFAVIFFIFWFLFKVGGMPDISKALLSTSIDVTLGMITLLVTVEILLPRFIYKNKYGLFAFFFLLIIFLSGTGVILSQLQLLNSSLFEYRKNIAKYQEHFFYWFWADLIFGSYFLVFFISSVGAAIRFAFDRAKVLNMSETLEKKKLHAELDLLRNQINPHFLFNALNTIYYKIDRSNQSARETLERFSKMLRFQLYECNKPYIAIEEELNFLSSYIDLQKERLNENYHVVCKGFDEVTNLMISPFLLMPVIENCFKHISDSVDKENNIFIECRKARHTFLLITSNSVNSKAGEEKTGIGLENMQKRLELVYPNKHELITKRTADTFELTLKLDLL